MSDEENKKLLYQPDLGIPQSYYSDGVITQDEVLAPDESQENESENLINDTNILKQSLLFIPGAIRLQTESILNLVYFLLVITNKPDGDADDTTYYITKPTEKPNIVDNTSKGVSDFFKDHHPVTILKQSQTNAAKIERYYSNSILEITRHYLAKLGDILASYHTQIFANPQVIDYLEEVYSTSLTDYKNYVAHSILQTLLKSQQEKFSKMRLYQKLYNEKQSLTLLKSLEYSKLTLLKALGNEPKDPKLYYKHIQATETEQKRLDKKMFEYYRYLNSSLDVLEACLNMNLTEGIAKAELYKLNQAENKDK